MVLKTLRCRSNLITNYLFIYYYVIFFISSICTSCLKKHNLWWHKVRDISTSDNIKLETFQCRTTRFRLIFGNLRPKNFLTLLTLLKYNVRGSALQFIWRKISSTMNIMGQELLYGSDISKVFIPKFKKQKMVLFSLQLVLSWCR